MKHVIELKSFGGPVFAGRPRGERIREFLEIDSWDTDPECEIDVIVPDGTLGITASFVGGLLSRSVKAAGSRDVFFKRFHFTLPKEGRRDQLMARVIEAEVERALYEPHSLLNG